MVWLIEGLVEIFRTVLYVALLPVVFLFLLFIAIFRPSLINRLQKEKKVKQNHNKSYTNSRD